jgi:uncharacterized protein
MHSHDDGLAAVAYSPCEVRVTVRNSPIILTEDTEYPFRGTIRILVNPRTRVSFPLLLRIPAWADETAIRVNGELTRPSAPGSFARIERSWTSGDVVEIMFPLRPRASRWFNDSIAIERGPLVFSYGIVEDWVKLRDRGMTAD